MKKYNVILIERLQKYLTVEEILPSNQQQIIEKAKFIYSPLEKAFKKQTRTIEDRGKKQVDALADLKPKERKPRETKPNEYGDYFLDGLANHFKDPNISSVNFSKFKGLLHTFKSIHKGDITLEDVEKEKFWSHKAGIFKK